MNQFLHSYVHIVPICSQEFMENNILSNLRRTKCTRTVTKTYGLPTISAIIKCVILSQYNYWQELCKHFRYSGNSKQAQFELVCICSRNKDMSRPCLPLWLCSGAPPLPLQLHKWAEIAPGVPAQADIGGLPSSCFNPRFRTETAFYLEIFSQTNHPSLVLPQTVFQVHDLAAL